MFIKVTREETGWLMQTEGRWLGQLNPALAAVGCDETAEPGFFAVQYGKALRWLRRVRPQFARRRNPMDTLAPWLSAASPMKEYILPMIGRMEAELLPPTGAGAWEFYAERRLILVVAFFCVPMRLLNWRTCRVGRELVRTPDGLYHLRVQAADAKTRGALWRNGRSKCYDVRIPDWAQCYFARFVETVMPRLGQDADARYLFTDLGGAMLGESGFTCLFGRVFRDYFGFNIGAHAARHILATDYLKDDPRNVYVVAVLLAELPETVKEHYADLVDQDVFDGYNKYASDLAAQVLGRRDPLTLSAAEQTEILRRHGITELPDD